MNPKLSQEIRNPIIFAEKLLGLPVSKHLGQVKWLENSTRQINILRPGNKWGKSLVAAIKHIHHAALKPLMPPGLTDEEWLRLEYNTLNFGPGYEQAREVLKMVRDIIQGNVIIPEQFREEYGNTNSSFFKDWFITEDRADAAILPHLKFDTNVYLYGRSYDEMGTAFKMKSLAFISGDECGDVAELWTFTNNTLLPRLSRFKNPSVDFYGTPQPSGYDYMTMIDMAEEDMKRPDYKDRGLYFTQKGTMYENVFLPKETIESFERIMDPVMKRQVIYGEYVETGDKYFGFSRITNAIDKSLQLQEHPEPGHKYITGCDFAGGESVWADFSVFITVDYTSEPYKIIQFERFKGGDVPIPMQYKRVEEIVKNYGSRLIIDASALGGKNAKAFLSHLNPISAEFGPNKQSTFKSDMLAAYLTALDGGQSETRKRKTEKNQEGDWVDLNPEWGLIRLPDIPVWTNEHVNYKLADAKIRNDIVMCMAMIIHWIEMRRPKKQDKPVVDFDFLGI